MNSTAKNDDMRHQPIDTATRDRTSPVWDMSQERAFIETLLNQRFNFFLLLFSVSIAGGLNSKTQLQMALVLTAGAVVTMMLAAVLERSQEKLDLIFMDLKQDSTHPLSIIDARARKGGSRRRLIGVWIPRFCCSALYLGSIIAWTSL